MRGIAGQAMIGAYKADGLCSLARLIHDDEKFSFTIRGGGGDLLDEKKKALIIVDVQKAFDDKKWGERNNLNVEENISKILQSVIKGRFPVIRISAYFHFRARLRRII